MPFFPLHRLQVKQMPQTSPVSCTPVQRVLLTKITHLKAVTLRPGVPLVSTEDFQAQMILISFTGPYLLKACKTGEEDKFYQQFFNIWFVLWPQTPMSIEDIPFVQYRVKRIMMVLCSKFYLFFQRLNYINNISRT